MIKQKFKSLHDILKQINFILSSRQKRKAIWVFINIVIAAFFETLGVSIILPFITAVLKPESLMENKYIAVIMKWLNINDELGLMFFLAGSVIGVYIVKNIYLLYSGLLQKKFECMLQKELSTEMLVAYLKRPYTYFLEVNSASMMRGINSDVAGVYKTIDNIFKVLAETLATGLIGSFIFVTEPVMAVVVLIMAFFFVCLFAFGLRRKSKEAGQEWRQSVAATNQYALQAIQGIKEISVLHRKKFFADKYEEAYEQQRKALVTYGFLESLPKRIVEVVFISAIIIMLCFKMSGGTDAVEYITKLSTFAVAAIRILPSISSISTAAVSIMYHRSALSAAYENFKEARAYEGKLEDNDSRVAESLKKEKFKEIHVRNVVWRYNNSDKNVLDNLQLDIVKGQSVALIGESGSGKTTLADVILGLLHPQSGSVEIDGWDIFSIPRTWSDIVGYVPQTVYLTDDTIRNNVAFGVGEEEIEDTAVWKALEQAQLKDFVNSLPQKIDTVVGERGIKFSGGQRQRIAIARALYHNPEILVMDEATSALDNETETYVMEAIDSLQGHKTLVIIAHRLSTIRNCDYIYAVKDGKATLCKKETIFEN